MAVGSISSSQRQETSAWTRLVMPSAADLIFAALLGVLVFTPLSVRLVGDAGIGWHIRTGQQILATHSVPRVDLFSSTMSGKPWFAWEWLYDVAVGRLDASRGLNAVVWFTAVVIAAVFSWMFRLLMRRGTSILVAIVLTLLAISASMIHFLARPHVVSWLFTLAWFWILDSSEQACLDGSNRYGKRLWLLPLLMLVWVNVHGGFLVGFALLAIYWAGAVWNWFQVKESRIEDSLRKLACAKRVRNLSFVCLLASAASFANPYGWKLHEHIYSYLSNRFLMDHIDEFQSPNFHGVAQKCFLVLLLITLIALAARGRNLRMSEGMTVLFAVYAGLFASRNIPISSILLVMVLGPLLSVGVRPEQFFQRMAAIEVKQRGHALPILAVALVLFIVVNQGRWGSTLLINAHFDPQRMPADAVNYLVNHDVKGPVLSPDFWGGYVIYRLYPKEQVVLDDRHDLYGADFFKSYLKLVHVEPGWQDFLQESHASCLLLPKQSPLANRIVVADNWRGVYSDNVAVVFLRQSETH